MDDKRVSHRLKRQTKRLEQEEGGAWDCSVCTYRNTAEAFKCSVCDVRKGTATRKPRLNPSVVQQQVTVQQFTAPLPKKEKTKLKNRKNGSPRLKNIDRKSGQDLMVTVGDVTVVITDYKPKEKRAKADPSYLDDDHTLVGGPEDSDDRAEESMDHSNNNTINTSGASSKMTSSSDEESD